MSPLSGASAPPGLKGRQVVITGGTGALGGSVVEAFVRAGAVCHVPVRDTKMSLEANRVEGVEYVLGVDLTSESAVASFYAGISKELWASVHLAGGFAIGGITETSLVDLRSQIDINVVTTFLCCREAVRRFRLRPGGGGGRIVNMAARAALEATAGKAAYSLSKAAVVSLTATLAEELKREHILVNAIAPGTIDTARNRAAMPNLDEASMVKPGEIAGAIVWLASPENQIASGAVVPVCGTS